MPGAYHQGGFQARWTGWRVLRLWYLVYPLTLPLFVEKGSWAAGELFGNVVGALDDLVVR
jgi:hypothetical protein